MPVQTFSRNEALLAAEFLRGALHDLRNRDGMNSESAAQNILLGYLAGRVGVDRVEREVPAHRGRLDFVVHGTSRQTAIELVVRQHHWIAGTGARGYVLPRRDHIRDNVRKLLHFQEDAHPLRKAFLLVVDRNGPAAALTCGDVVEEYRKKTWAWRGPAQCWHENSFQLVVASDGEAVAANIKNRTQ